MRKLSWAELLEMRMRRIDRRGRMMGEGWKARASGIVLLLLLDSRGCRCKVYKAKA